MIIYNVFSANQARQLSQSGFPEAELVVTNNI